MIRLRLQPLHQRQYQYQHRPHLPWRHRLPYRRKIPLATFCQPRRQNRLQLLLRSLSMINLQPRKFRLFRLRNDSCNNIIRVGIPKRSLVRTLARWYPHLLEILMPGNWPDEPHPEPLHYPRRILSKSQGLCCRELAFGPLL